MADETDQSEKTEDPSQRKLEEAHKKGDVPKSQEVTTWFSVFGIALALMIFGSSMSSGMAVSMRGFLEHAHQFPIDQGGLLSLIDNVGANLFGVILLPLTLLALLSVAGNVVQHKPVLTIEKVKPKFNKVSPLAGFKRLFSKDSLMNFVKGLAKIGIVAAVMVVLMWPERERLEGLITMDLAALMGFIQFEALKLIGGVIAILAVVAIADFLWQRHQWFEKQKMSLKELKDEYKDTEGDPAIKARIRQLRQERSRNRMMAAVPDASVIVTNPTHYAVALKYEAGMPAPVCVAKGVDTMALKIRQVGREAEVPIIENPPLARALHATVDVEEPIPEEHYRAVAEVISYVMRLKKRRGWAAS
ncbi:flagellar biosynthesis protein FlhB [Coralliovum pocilloporae]|uniref:flagellar biosynthesis protein FlhB n=1 Tax=Coralliovum pocilloporae TaxID=3066369 RepID=UPI003306BB26